MTDLVEFLRARLDDDEQTAREAGNRRWLVQDNIIELYPERDDDGFMSWPTRADAHHAARWEPARVLREVQAKRRIIEWYEQQAAKQYENAMEEDRAWTLEPVLRDLAEVYADHEDFREEWRP